MKKEKSCGCIIIQENKILMVKQKKGHWGFPKGHVEEGETEQETAIREVEEETNIKVEIISDSRYWEKYTTDKGNEKEVVYFIAKKLSGDLKEQEAEIQEVKWIEKEKVLDTITYETTKNMFKYVLKNI